MSLIWPILSTALTHPKKIAVIDDQRQYTYAQIVGGAMFLAEQIDQVSGKPHIGIMLPTGGLFPMALLGAWLARRVAIPLNYLLSKEELGYVIQDSEIDTILTVGPMLEFIGGASVIPPHIKVVQLENCDFTGFPPLRWPPMPAGDDLAVILYTSGTSGKPKGVMLTHRNLRTNVDAGIKRANITHADVFLGVLPQFHSFGMTALTLIPLRIGAKVVYSARFVPKRIVELVRKHRPDIVMAIPSMYGALLSVKDLKPEDLACIRLAISGGEPLPAATFDEFHDRLGLTIYEGYGLTETSPVTNWCTPELFHRRSVGPTVPGVEIIIVDDHNRILPANQDGEILITGPNIMKGYFKLPQQTRDVFIDLDIPTRTGSSRHVRFFRSGDIGRLDDEGFLYITGRKKEMLIIGGENVFPREIEEVLNKHPAVRESAVIGRQDGMRGEVPVAFIEINDGHSFDDTALRSWCREHLAGYKVPRDIRQIEQLPRNPTGKILRRKLKAD